MLPLPFNVSAMNQLSNMDRTSRVNEFPLAEQPAIRLLDDAAIRMLPLASTATSFGLEIAVVVAESSSSTPAVTAPFTAVCS